MGRTYLRTPIRQEPPAPPKPARGLQSVTVIMRHLRDSDTL